MHGVPGGQLAGTSQSEALQMLPAAHVVVEGQSLSLLHPQYCGPLKKDAHAEP
jgi:hypothetical protein